MADEEKFLPQQESLLALLCFDGPNGSKIAAQVQPKYFDDIYRDFATRVLQYRRRHRTPPGERQIRDLADQSFTGKDNVVVKKRLIPRILAGIEGINVEYVVSRAQDWIEGQLLKGALMEAGDRWEVYDDSRNLEVKQILQGALRFQAETLNAGLFLGDPKLLQFSSGQNENQISLGIPELDAIGVGLNPTEMLLYIAPKGTGKTWFCVHCGRMGLLQRKKVLHVSNEMSEEKVGRRYLQSLFSVSRNMDPFNRARIMKEGDRFKRMTGFKIRKYQPKRAFTQSKITRVLRRKQQKFGTRLNNLVIKDFPSGMMTLDMLTSYLDYLADVHDFVPDILIVDYPDLMATSAKTLRIDIGQNFVGLRGIAKQRNMALVTPTQSNKKTIRGKRTRSSAVTEDISKVMTADTTLAFSRTEQEELYGLGRLSVEHARDTVGGSVILLSQGYHIGQYVLDSALLPVSSLYDDLLKELDGGGTDDFEGSD